MGELFSKLISTLAVILVMAGFISGSDLYNKFLDDDKNWKYPLFSGILGGLFGIYGNLSGTEVSGAVISEWMYYDLRPGYIYGLALFESNEAYAPYIEGILDFGGAKTTAEELKTKEEVYYE